MNTQHSICIAKNHPSLEGHFPGNPVVPGVVILDEVIYALQQQFPDSEITGFASVKFLSPLLPEQPFQIEFSSSKANRIKFECKKDQAVFASGLLKTA